MKTGKTLSELAVEIERQNGGKEDFIQTTRKMHVEVGNDDSKNRLRLIVDNAGDFPMTDHALTQLSAHAMGEGSTRYMRRMQAEAPALLQTNLNHWLKESPKRRMVRTLFKDARAFVSDQFNRIDNIDVAGVALPIFSELGLKVVSCEVTESNLYLKATNPNLKREIVGSPRVGDFVEAGITVRNSEIGLGSAAVDFFALFLACLNGMKRNGGKSWAHLGARIPEQEQAYLAADTVAATDRASLLRIRDTIRHAFDGADFEKWIGQVGHTVTQPITGSIEKGLEVLSKKLTLSDDERNSVLRHLIAGGDLSKFGLINAVTRSAEDSASYDRATDLEAAGDRVLNLSVNDWREVANAA